MHSPYIFPKGGGDICKYGKSVKYTGELPVIWYDMQMLALNPYSWQFKAQKPKNEKR